MGSTHKKQQANDFAMSNQDARTSKHTHSDDTSSSDVMSQQLSFIVDKLHSLDVEMKDMKKQKQPTIVIDQLMRDTERKDEELEHNDAESSWWSKTPNRRPHTKVDFPKFEGSDPRGWVMKAEKYFRYYQTPEDLKVEVAAMNLEEDALDVFTWVSSSRTIRYWEDLIQVFQEHFRPAKFQSPDVYLCEIRQTGTVEEYRKEFVRRSSRVGI